MAQYTKSVTKQGDKDVTRYKDGGQFVKGDDVPANVKQALQDNPDGTIIDETGEVVNPETDEDESGDEPAPTGPEDEADEGDEPDEGDEEEETRTAPAEDPRSLDAVPQDNPGMGYKRSGGKTLSIFSNKPHETVKNVAGIMVPMTHDEYNSKTDAEILAKLRKLKKL